MERLTRLNGWQLLAALLGIGLATALAVWGGVWVLWTIRPILAALSAVGAVAWITFALRRHRSRTDWRGEEWLGS